MFAGWSRTEFTAYTRTEDEASIDTYMIWELCAAVQFLSAWGEMVANINRLQCDTYADYLHISKQNIPSQLVELINLIYNSLL